MLVYNKYLKELGYKKSDFPFDRTEKKDSRYGLDKTTGTVEAQTWNLYITIVLELYTYMRDFQDHYMKLGLPGPFIDKKDGEKEYHQVVQDIIDGLRASIEVRDLFASDFGNDWEAYRKACDEYYKKFDKGWKLLGKYLDCFWW